MNDVAPSGCLRADVCAAHAPGCPERVRGVLAPRRGEARRRAADERRHGSAAADLAEGAMGEAWLV